jgi:hypothetical protein
MSDIVAHSKDAYEAIRAINHAAITAAHPAPIVYSILGNLGNLGLDQALRELGEGLERSLEMYAVGEDDGSDPAVAVSVAIDLLTQARNHADRMCVLIRRAQGAISGQHYDELPK